MDIVFAIIFILGAVFLVLAAVSEDALATVVRLICAGLALACLGAGGLVWQRFTPPQLLVSYDSTPERLEHTEIEAKSGDVPQRLVVAEFRPQCAITLAQDFPLALILGTTITQTFPRPCDALTAEDRAILAALQTELTRPL